MVSIELQPADDVEKPPRVFRDEDSLSADVEEIDLPFLTEEALSKAFALHEFKIKFTDNLSSDEIFPFMARVNEFEEKIRTKALSGELMYGDNVIQVEDLPKFALYNILIGRNITPEVTWLDLEDGLIEKFMRNGFSE